ncbi:hypothetical protein SNEBB_005477 [Seison nebaliae]|nr:hypothetical protein SNEBB_005477 [Seison nebaliae]
MLLQKRLIQTLLKKNVFQQYKQTSAAFSMQEYSSKKLMEDYMVDVQKFIVVNEANDAKHAADTFLKETKECVIKAQVLAGGRGKGVFSNGFKGGVHLTSQAEKAEEIAEKMLNNRLKTKQTGKDGVLVTKLMVAEALDIAKETYFAILLDRETNGPVLVGSPQGGMDIEEVAEKTPEAIFKLPVNIEVGLSENDAIEMAKNLQFKGASIEKAALQMLRLYNMFVELEAVQIEINPLGETPKGRVVCFDAKFSFDDNSKFRQKEIFDLEDLSETDPREVQAKQQDLNYIQMEGNIGCLVNGAGLAMATMDIIKLHGGQPANFLDCGGGVEASQVTKAFQLLTSDSKVKAILVNIFGGIVNCETIANGILEACKTVKLNIPVVVRLEGTNADVAGQLLSSSGVSIITATTFEDAAEKIVSCL